jgi:hypothetical protein
VVCGSTAGAALTFTGSLRRECLDHLRIVSEAHLQNAQIPSDELYRPRQAMAFTSIREAGPRCTQRPRSNRAVPTAR